MPQPRDLRAEAAQAHRPHRTRRKRIFAPRLAIAAALVILRRLRFMLSTMPAFSWRSSSSRSPALPLEHYCDRAYRGLPRPWFFYIRRASALSTVRDPAWAASVLALMPARRSTCECRAAAADPDRHVRHRSSRGTMDKLRSSSSLFSAAQLGFCALVLLAGIEPSACRAPGTLREPDIQRGQFHGDASSVTSGRMPVQRTSKMQLIALIGREDIQLGDPQNHVLGRSPLACRLGRFLRLALLRTLSAVLSGIPAGRVQWGIPQSAPGTLRCGGLFNAQSRSTP